MGNLDKINKPKTVLSRRQKQIIQILTQMNAKPITVAAVSEKLKVSSRTILREMPRIEEWLNENDFKFSRKTGVGLQIIENQENLDLINELLELDHTSRVLGKDERRRRLLGELLFNVDPVKAYAFTSEYGISEGTLFGDLDYLESWLEQHKVKLVRRQGMGIFIEADEIAIRHAIVNAIFDLYDLSHVVGLLPMGHEHPVEFEALYERPPLLVFLSAKTISVATRVLEETRQKLDVRYRDSALIGLYIRIALAVYRIQCGQVIQSPVEDQDRLVTLKEYEVAESVSKWIEKEIGKEMNRNEILSLTSFLSSARIWADASFFSNPMRAMEIRHAVTSMVGIVENMTGLTFRGNRLLIEDLVSHISAIAERNYGDTLLEYAQIAPIRKNYPEIYAAVETACEILSDSISTNDIMTADVGFLTMHFAAAAERIQAEQEKVVIAVVCPLGIAASRMLASSLTRSISNIEVRKTISAFEIESEKLKEDGIDLIVSTTELHTDFPHVCVGKILQTQDKLKIQNRIDDINRARLLQKTKRRMPFTGVRGLEDIRRTALTATEIVELIENFYILRLHKVRDYEELQAEAARLFAQNVAEKEQIHTMFRLREKMGSTYFKEMKMCLFHCKADLVQHSRFGYIRLEQPLRTHEGVIEGSVVMVAPGHLDVECLEPLSRLSALLIEEPSFLQALQNGDTTAGVAMAENALVKYYINSMKK